MPCFWGCRPIYAGCLRRAGRAGNPGRGLKGAVRFGGQLKLHSRPDVGRCVDPGPEAGTQTGINPKPASEAQTQAPPKEETQTPAQTTVQNKPGAVSSAPRASAINAASAAGTSSFARSEDPSALSSLQSEAPSEASSGIRLPSVAEVSGAGVLSAPVSDDDNDQINWLGIISWVCIGIGILIVVVVILSNRRPPRSGYGRTRYKRQKSRRRGRKARLLNDKYYRRL
ncbi:MAG: hypothetical protein ACLSB9_28115 [Hydrogeniiclostridium mannosilyticum]